MNKQPAIKTLLEAFNKLPQSEQSDYSILAHINKAHAVNQNKEPARNRRRELTSSFDIISSTLPDEPVGAFDVFGHINEVKISSLPYSLDLTNQLFISDIHAANDLGMLRKHQIFSILSLGKSNKPLTYPSVKGGYRCVPLEDSENANILKQMLGICSFLDAQLQKGNVLVHCFRGENRSCAAVVGYLMRKYSLGYEGAEEIVKDARKTCKISSNFKKQLSISWWSKTYF